MNKELLFFFLIFLSLGIIFSTGSTLDNLGIVLLVTFILLTYYNLSSLLEGDSLFYIFSKSNKYFPPKMIEMFFTIFFGIIFAFLALPVSMFLLDFLSGIIFSAYNYFNLPELSNLPDLSEPLILCFLFLIAIAFDVLFLKMLKRLFLSSSDKIQEGEGL
jgi:hypothetical protein